jgi:hypothetical protein
MSGPLHHHQTVVHRPFAAVYADEAARLAADGFDGESEFFATDLYKVVLQESDNTVWMLTAVTPTWVQITGEGSVVTDVDDLTTATGLATEMLRVAASGDELEYRTPAEVLTDIGAAADDHVHGNLSNDGKVGSTAGLVIVTTTDGLVVALAAGTSGEFLAHDATWQTPPAGLGQKNSIEEDAGDLQLVGDVASPGNNKTYGTDGSGTRVWKDDPAGGDFVPKLADIIDVSSSRDLASSDSAAILTATATVTINCPNGLDAGLQCVVARIGGTTTITATTTLQYLDNGAQTAASGVTVDTQCTLLHRGSNVWLVLGEVTPV